MKYFIYIYTRCDKKYINSHFLLVGDHRRRHHRLDKKIQKVQNVDNVGFIPKPPPFIHDLTKQDKQNNNLQHQQSVAVQTTTTTATVHVPKQQSIGKYDRYEMAGIISVSFFTFFSLNLFFVTLFKSYQQQ